jgi:hypothetical protein
VLIQMLFSIRSERQLMEQMQYNLLFRWFVGLGIDDPVWAPTVFSKNRDRLLTTDIARQFLAAILANKAVAPLSDEHFSVDVTLIQAWASMKSFSPEPARAKAWGRRLASSHRPAAMEVWVRTAARLPPNRQPVAAEMRTEMTARQPPNSQRQTATPR